MEAVVKRLELVAERLEKQLVQSPAVVASPSTNARESANAPSGDLSKSWNDALISSLSPLASLTESLNDEQLNAAFSNFKIALSSVSSVIKTASRSIGPDPAAMQSLVTPIGLQIQTLMSMADKSRRLPAFNHIKVLSECAQMLQWVMFTPGPSSPLAPPPQLAIDALQAAEFFTNKILQEWRGKDERQVLWVKGVKELMTRIEGVLKTNFTQGLIWAGSSGVPLKEAMANTSSVAATPAVAPIKPPPPPPPPPPGPPPPPLSIQKLQEASSGPLASVKAQGSSEGMAALFKDIAKGEGLTSGLKKVTDDMKTKSRTDRTSVVSMSELNTPAAQKGPAGGARSTVPSGVARIELQDRKWVVEYQVGARGIVVEVTDPRHSVYIYGCKDTLIKVQGKANNIALDSCSKTGVVFGDVIAAVEVVNCKSVQLQASGIVPTINVEKTDGCQLFLNHQLALDGNFQIVTAKCSEMNVVLAGSTEEEQPREEPIPEQFISSFVNGKLVTQASSHSGA